MLGRLAELTEDEHTRIRACTMLARLGLSAALHVHPGIGCWAGPFSRAYSHAVFNADAFNADDVRAWLDGGQVPAWVGDLLQRSNVPQQIDETAHGEEPVALSTYHSPSFSSGRGLLRTEDPGSHLYRPAAVQRISRPVPSSRIVPAAACSFRVIYSTTSGSASRRRRSRAPGQVVPEEGYFYGVHERGRAIGLYAPRGLDAWTRRTSAKAVLVWTEIAQVDEIWIGQHKVDSLPTAVPWGEVVVVGSGALWTAVRPLELTDLGGGAPIRLVELDGHLALEMYNYTGPAKTFWEMAKPGSFYQGQPRCGFYAELAERTSTTPAVPILPSR